MNSIMPMDRIRPCLWFDKDALTAAEFYTSLFPNSKIDHVHRSAADTPSAKTGEVLLVAFTLFGRNFEALKGGPQEKFSHAVSLSVLCDDQAEVDRLWEAFIAGGGQPVACGWLKDRFGLSWQIVPKRLLELINDPDREKARLAMEAMMKMVKIDVATIEEACRKAS